MAISVELSVVNLILLGVLYFLGKKAMGFYKAWKMEKILEKYSNTAKDKVILHGVPRGKTLPSISPYCLKLETFLRMNAIDYEFDPKEPFGPKGKSPWITLNSTHVADSELAIKFLLKKLDLHIDEKISDEQKGICRAVRVMLENHFVQGLAMYRWSENFNNVHEIISFPKTALPFIYFLAKRVENSVKSQGFGAHTKLEQCELASGDLHTASKILGTKQFFGGDTPCREDCAIFGVLAQALWASPGSSYEKLIDNQLLNLKEYCHRMKSKYWADWESCLEKPN